MHAARPLLDKHQWDKYFAMFARDVNVPWKPTAIRLDTYSGAPVDFTIYNVDPADVIVAGANETARALDTAHRKPLAHWRFSPPRGYRFEASDVRVPLGSQEGFYVVRAERGDAVQQVWLNRTHIGLLAQDSPDGLLFWGVDLRDGRAIPHLRLSLLVGRRLVDRQTDAAGVLAWHEPLRPSFALAQNGAGRAFMSILPQPPPPPAIVGIRLDSAVVRAGGWASFVGFARKRTGAVYRCASGNVRIMVLGRGRVIATATARLDEAGAFSGRLAIPAGLDAGDYAVIASSVSGVGGTSLHVDAASDVTLAVRSACPCDPARDVPITIVAQRGDLPAADIAVRAVIIRSPHVPPPDAAGGATRWGTTVVADRMLRTDAQGVGHVVLSSPSDGLDSTYEISASTRGASATASIVVPNAPVALALEPLTVTTDVGAPMAFDVRGFDPTDGSPAAGLTVRVTLSHGANTQEQQVQLDARGRGSVVFRRTSLGSNLAIAQATVDGRTALDAAAVLVEPTALATHTTLAADDRVTVALDKSQYRPGDHITVRVDAPAASGDALISLTGVRTYAVRRTHLTSGHAESTLSVGEPQGDVRVDVACVRDGAMALGTAQVNLIAPGHEVPTKIAMDRRTYAAGETARATLQDGNAPTKATLAIRIADAAQSGPASFGDVGDVLASGATLEQTPSSSDPQWHAYVAPAGSKAADIFAADRPRKVVENLPVIGAIAHTVYWRVAPAVGSSLDVPVPSEPGRYVLSILRIAQDGDVGAASTSFVVR